MSRHARAARASTRAALRRRRDDPVFLVASQPSGDGPPAATFVDLGAKFEAGLPHRPWACELREQRIADARSVRLEDGTEMLAGSSAETDD